MKTNRVIILLLIAAILFSVFSIALNLSLNYSFKPVSSLQQNAASTGAASAGNGGKINLNILKPGEE